MDNAKSSINPKKIVEQGYDQVASDYACLEGENKMATHAMAQEITEPSRTKLVRP